MATLFCDFENGNDNHAGSSFATLADGIDGTIVTATFTSITASFPNDGSLIGQYLSIFNGTIYAVYNITAWVSATSLTIAAISGGTALANQTARQYYIGGRWKNITTGATAVRTVPGDTIRIMGSPEPTSLGQNGVWTSQALQATKTLTAATNATPIAITITGHGYSTGDTVVVTGVGGNTAANGTWEITVTDANTFTLDGSAGNGNRTSGGTARLRNNTRVMLASPVTQNIASTGPGRADWTTGASVTATLSTTTKQHRDSDSIAIAAGFTTGLAAYWPTGTIDLSGYQQVSFWIRQTTGTIGAAGAVDLRLCSDAAGVTAVNTISIPNLAVTGRWMPVTVDLATNLGSSIQSIALYVNTDNGAQTFLLNNIIACKASSAADSLTLTSLIGKNTTGETFWGIQSINGTRVMLDADTNATPTSATLRGYYGTSETVTTWKRETIKLGPAASSTTALQTIQESGTDGSPITYSGGWDRTAMSTQNLETWLDGVNGHGRGIVNLNRSFISLDKLAAVRFDQAYSLSNQTNIGITLDMVAANNCSTAPISFGDIGIIRVNNIAANNGAPFLSTRLALIEIGAADSNSGGVSSLSLGGSTTVKCAFRNGGAYAIALDYNPVGALFNNCAFDGNASGSVGLTATDTQQGFLRFKNCLFSDATEIAFSSNGTDTLIFSHDHDQTAGNHKIFMSGALISSATDQRHTASGISWKLQPTSANRSSAWPVTLSLAKVACAANSLVTIKAWMRRTNTGLTMRLVCKGGQIAGVTSDVVSAMTAAADTWAEQTITFTPTEVGVVEITAEAYGGTTFSGWVDDMTISQA
jgi:hypothetical protein